MSDRPIWEIFADALLLPKEERSAFLDRESVGRPEMRREIDRMLEAADRDPFIRSFAFEELEPNEELPRTVGAYRLVERVGRGGMGIVYRAKETSIDLDIAIKRIAPELAIQSRFVDLLRREARTLAALRHPNIAAVHRLDDVDGELLLVMEWIEGETVAKRIEERGRLDWRRTVTIAKAIASALHYAHEHGIIHCDLKPGNVMLTEHDEIKVLDFGIARAMHGSRGDDANDAAKATATEARLRGLSYSAGTPGYISPEREQGEIDPRADIWGLGALMQECLSGCAAFPATIAEGPDGRGIGPRRPLRVPPGTPSALKRLIDSCLHPDPKRRPQSMEEVMRRLRRIERRTELWIWRAAVGVVVTMVIAWLGVEWLSRREWRNLREVEIEGGSVRVTSFMGRHRLSGPSPDFPPFKKVLLLRPDGSRDPIVVAGGSADPRSGVATLVIWDRWKVTQRLQGPSTSTFSREGDLDPALFQPNEWNELRALPGPDAAFYVVAACCANYFPSRCYIFDFEGKVGKRQLHQRYQLDHGGHVASCTWTGRTERGKGLIWIAGSVNGNIRALFHGHQGCSYFVACMPDSIRGEGIVPPSGGAPHGALPSMYSGIRGYEQDTVEGREVLVSRNSTPFEFLNRSAAGGGSSNDTALLSTTLSCRLSRADGTWRAHWTVSDGIQSVITDTANREGRDPDTALASFVADSIVTLLYVAPGIDLETNVRRKEAGW